MRADEKTPAPQALGDEGKVRELTYVPPAVVWEQVFEALASCSINPCDCPPPLPDFCSGG